MLRALRKARFGQILLAIASLLAVTGSLGLHPEPDRITLPASQDGFVSWHGSRLSEETSHDCLACLGHRSVTLARLSGVVLEPGPAVLLLLAPRAGRPLSAATRTHEGRAPPALA